MYHHRSGKLKQQNKGHKGSRGFSSKRLLDKAAGGKVAEDAKVGVKAVVKSLSTARDQKAAKVMALKTAKLASRHASTATPRNVTVYALSPTANPYAVVGQLMASATTTSICANGTTASSNNPLILQYSTHSKATVYATVCPRGGQTLADNADFVFDVTHSLSHVRTADILVAVVDMRSYAGPTEANSILDEHSELFLTCLKATGVPSILAVLQGIDLLPSNKQSDARKYAHRLFASEFGEDHYKIVEVPYHSDTTLHALADGTYTGTLGSERSGASMQLSRTLCTMPLRVINWRSQRTYLQATGATYNAADKADAGDADAAATGTLSIAGYLRGRPLNVHQLINIPSSGVYQIEKVYKLADPIKRLEKAGMLAAATESLVTVEAPCAEGMPFIAVADGIGKLRGSVRVFDLSDSAAEVLAAPNPAYQEPLECVAEGDTTAGEQTWPVDAEEGPAEGEDGEASSKRGPRRPKGMSAYQAAWLVDSDEDEEDGERDADGEADDDEEEEYTDGENDGIEDPEKKKEREERRRAELLAEREKLQQRRHKKKLDRAEELLPPGYKPSAELDLEDTMSTRREQFDADGDAMAEDEEFAEDDEAKHLSPEEERTRLRAAAADEMLFPDEVETPIDIPARTRFSRYRGLKSFRTSPWVASNDHPSAYSHIAAIDHYSRWQRVVLEEAALAEKAMTSMGLQALLATQQKKKQQRAAQQAKQLHARKGSVHAGAGDDTEMVGEVGAAVAAEETAAGTSLADVLGEGWIDSNQYVILELRKVPEAAAANASLPGAALQAFSLLRYENRASVMHYNIIRHDSYAEPIASKEHLEFHVGNRVFDARPLFSIGDLKSDRAKLDRFFQHGKWTTATCLAPISYGGLPVLVFKRIPRDGVHSGEDHHGVYPAPDVLAQLPAASQHRLQLVATGGVHTCDPQKLILKKVVLSGYPIKVKQRNALVKLMFFNPEDVEYFKPVDVFTKHGLVGNIKMAVGTHGHMKCVFDRIIKQHDTVCMALYKRAFPRWGDCYEAVLPTHHDAERKAQEEFARGMEE